MKVIIAPCGMGDSISPEVMAISMERGVKYSIPEAVTIKYPLLKGDNPLDQAKAFGGEFFYADTTDPYFRKIQAKYGVLGGDQVILDLTEASGLKLLTEDEKNPLFTSTYGSGTLILDALDKGLRDFYIFTKGSATNDGGVGLLTALGFRFLDSNKESVTLNGSGLYSIREIDDSKADKRLKDSRFTLVTDYANLYSGVRGIAYSYGPTKGASPLMIHSLDRGLRNYALEVEKATGVDVDKLRGTGAGGGTGAGVVSFLKAEVISFVDAFKTMTGVDDEIRSANIVITGSTSVNEHSRLHKGMLATAEMAHRNHVPLIGIFGYLDNDYNDLYSMGFTGIYAIYNERLEKGSQWNDAGRLIEKMTAAVASMVEE